MGSIICLGLLSTPSFAQDKKPVAVTDTVIFPVSHEPLYEITIRPLDNDFSQHMHPVVVHTAWGSELTITTTLSDSTITLLNYAFEGIDSVEYQIRDTINNLTSNIAKIYIISQTGSYAFLETNNIRARINANGIHFRRYIDKNDHVSQFFVDQGRTFCDFKLWIAGKDPSGVVHSAPSWYGTNCHFIRYVYEYWPGPVSVNYPDDFNRLWERVWVISRHEIDHHRDYFNDPGYHMPEAIVNWPAHGDTSMGQARDLAPYVDYNDDNIYNPDKGDYPLIKGNQAIYFICNDDRDEETTSEMPVFRTEIHGMAYAYDCPGDSNIHNTIFFQFKLFNRSDEIYNDVYVGANVEAMIGNHYDDYAGCDTSLHSFYGYNRKDADTGSYGFGNFPPAQALTFLNYPMNYFILHGGKSFPQQYNAEPEIPSQYYNYLKGNWIDSSHITYGANGHGGNQPVNHIYYGEPENPYEWTMNSIGYYMAEDYCLGSTGPFTLQPGESIPLDFSITFARDYGGDNISSISLIKQRIRKIREFYQYNDSMPCLRPSTTLEPVENNYLLSSFSPNPFSTSTTLSFRLGKPENVRFTVYNVQSKIVYTIEDRRNAGEQRIEWNANGLPAGLYFYRLVAGDRIGSGKLVVGD